MNDREYKVLKVLANSPITAKQIMVKTGLPRSTLYRILKNLKVYGFVYYDKDTQAYVITNKGLNALELAENKAIWRIHNIKVILRIKEHKLSRPDLASLIKNADSKANMNNWEAFYVDMRKYDINATVQVNIANDLSVIIHFPEFEAPSIPKATLIIQNEVEQVRKALNLEGIPTYREWVDLNFDRVLVRAEYALSAGNGEVIEPGVRVKLGKPAKSLDGKEMNEEAELWTDESKDQVEVETNDSDTAKTLEYLVKEAPKDIKETKRVVVETSGFVRDLKEVVKEMAEANKMLAENEKAHVGYAQQMVEAGRYFKEGAVEFREVLSTLIKVFVEDKRQQQELIQLLMSKSRTNYDNILLLAFIILFLIVVAKGLF